MLGGDLAEAEERGGRVQNGDADFGKDGADDVGFTEGAGAIGDKGKEETLEESGGFVKGFFQGVVEMDVKFLCLVDVVFDAVEENGSDEVLGYVRLS